MKKTGAAVIAFLVGALVHQPAMSQVSDRVFKQTFYENVQTGCLNSSKLDQVKKEAFCSCYAKSFVDRYSAAELNAIGVWLANNPNQVGVISVLMSPESSRCKLKR